MEGLENMALEKVKNIVSSNPVVVFSKSSCPFCATVKKLFSELGVTYKLIELNLESNGSEMQSALAQWTGQRTVPNVLIAGKRIGGCDSTIELQNQKKLVPLLTEVGAIAAEKVTT